MTETGIIKEEIDSARGHGGDSNSDWALFESDPVILLSMRSYLDEALVMN